MDTSEKSVFINKLKITGISFLLAILVLGVLSPARHYEFINFDDNIYITENPHVTTGLSVENAKWAFTHTEGGHWHPLTWLAHQTICQIFGVNPTAHHLVNITLHTINVLLIFWFLIKIFNLHQNTILPWLLSALFALHPVRLESVIWIAELKDTLSIFFGLLAMHSYHVFITRKKYGTLFLVITALLYSLSLLAKPTLVTFPILLMLLDIFLYQQKISVKLFVNKIPFFLLSFIFCITTLWAQNKTGAVSTLDAVSLSDRIAGSAVGYLGYLGKIFWPTHLSLFYPLQTYPAGIGAGALLALGIISIFFYKNIKKYPLALFAWLWFLISLLPMIGLIQAGGQALADRWNYLPHIGLTIALCGILDALYTKKSCHCEERSHLWRSDAAIHFLLLIILTIAIYKTSVDLPAWQNSQTIFEQALDSNPNNFLAHTNLALALKNKGRLNEAKWHDEEAVRLNPTYPEAQNNLGTIFAEAGNFTEAINHFQKAVARNSNFVNARYNLALARYQNGEKLKAITDWIELAVYFPNYSDTFYSLNYSARTDFEKICQESNDNSERMNLLESTKKWREIENQNLNAAINQLRICLQNP